MTYKTAYQQYLDYESKKYLEYKSGDDSTLSFFQWQQAGLVNKDLLPPAGSMLKDSFWAEIQERWPGEFHRFTTWIDEYKKKNDWLTLFNSNSEYQNVVGKNAVAPKFHDLPPAMQIGIFMQYCIQESHRYDFLEGQPDTMAKLVDMVTEWFCEEHEDALRDHQQGKYEADDFALN